jgi:hypothetical protein
MKRQLSAVLIILSIFSISACKKSSDVSSNQYLKLKINGSWVTLENAVSELGPDLADDTKIDLGLTAMSKDYIHSFDLTIQSGGQIPAGTYTSGTPGYDVVIYYTKNALGNNPLTYNMGDSPGKPEVSKYVVTITSITPTEIRGKFTGNYLSNWDTYEPLDITDGEFAAPRAR